MPIYSYWLVVEPYPSEKYINVSWDFIFPNVWKIKHVPMTNQVISDLCRGLWKNMETKTYIVGYFGSRNFRVFPFQLLHRKFHNSLSCSSNPSTCSHDFTCVAVQLHGQKMWFPGCLPHLYLHWMEMDRKKNWSQKEDQELPYFEWLKKNLTCYSDIDYI